MESGFESADLARCLTHFIIRGEGFSVLKRGCRPIVPVCFSPMLTRQTETIKVELDEKRLSAMRTLLTDSFPPQCMDEQTVSHGADAAVEPTGKMARTFPQSAVLISVDDLVEVGVDGTVIATPSALPAE